MCSPATCPECGMASYTGCGAHVEQVLAGVPADRRCSCDSSSSQSPQNYATWLPRWLGQGHE